MKRWCKAIAVFLPFVLLLFSINLYADPANLFNRDYETAAAAMIAGGENAANLMDMDDRYFITECLGQIDYPLETLVLGSSRSMQITRALTGCENQFCAGVTGGDLRDVISIYLQAKALGKQPKRVILVAEPWFLSETGINARARITEYVEFAKAIGSKPITVQSSKLNKAKELFSIPYFQSSLRFLAAGKHKQRQPVATDAFWSDTDMRRTDGSYCYNADYRNASAAKVDERAANLVKVPMENMSNFTGMDDNCRIQFEAFLGLMQADGVEIVLMIAPFHPDYYSYMSQTPKFAPLLETEPYFYETAQRYGATCFGSYDATALGLVNTDFYDGVHHSTEALEKFFPESLRQAPGAETRKEATNALS